MPYKDKIKAKEYKARFGMPYNTALISIKIYLKKVRKFNEAREKYLKNLKKGKHFKKGHSLKKRVSQLERERIIKRILKVNKERRLEACPICKMKYWNMDSHLYNAHNLLRIRQRSISFNKRR